MPETVPDDDPEIIAQADDVAVKIIEILVNQFKAKVNF